MNKIIFCYILLVTVIIVTSCGPSRTVSRIDSSEVTDLSGNWNDTDSRLVSEKMIESLSSTDLVRDFMIENEKRPVIIVGNVRNLTDEHINTNTFIKDIEREIVKSRWLTFVASKVEREEIRDERLEQQIYASEETAKQMLAETGADFMLRGSIDIINDSAGNQLVKYYQVNLELVNIENNEKYWVDSKKIKKVIERN